MNRTFRHPLLLILLCCSVLFGTSGCGDKYYKAVDRSIDYTVTDREILEFTNHVRHMLRTKMKWASVAAYVSSTISLATAATAATVGVTSGGGASVIRAVAALSASSLFTNDLISIFKMKDRAQAYQDGLALIESSEARYFQTMAKKKGRVENYKMTQHGADLYAETVGAIKLIEKALVNSIPTLEEVKQATGEHSDLRVSSENVTLTEANKNTDILVLKNGPVVGVASSHPDLVSVAHNGAVIDIRGQEGLFGASASKQKIKVTAVSAQGQSVEILVNADLESANKKRDPEETPELSETSHNVFIARRADISLDGQLSPTGLEQADDLDAKLRTLKVTHIYVMQTCGAIQTILPTLDQLEDSVVVKVFKLGKDEFKGVDPSNCSIGNILDSDTKKIFQKLLEKPDPGDVTTLASLQWLLKDIKNNKSGNASLIVHEDNWEDLLAKSDGFNTGFPTGWPSTETVGNKHDILVHLTTNDGNSRNANLHDFFKEKGSRLGFIHSSINEPISALGNGINLELDTAFILGKSGKKIKFTRKEDGQKIINSQLKILFSDDELKRSFSLNEEIAINDQNKNNKLEIIFDSITPTPPFSENEIETITLGIAGGEFIDSEKSVLTLTITPDKPDPKPPTTADEDGEKK